MTAKKIDWEERFFLVAKDLFVMCNNDYTLNEAIERAYDFVEKLKQFENEKNL